MTRLLATMKTDLMVQFRNRLYAIGVFVGAIIAVGLSQLASPEQLFVIVPVLMLIAVGGTTMLYIAALIIFERDEGTMNALIASPLRTSEYLWSKIITLTALSALESIVMIGGATLIMTWSHPVSWPNIPILLVGIIGIGVMYTLFGIILVVRYDKITDFLMPMAFFAVVLQLPFLHFLGLVVHPVFLVIPTSAPTMLMQGAYVSLAPWQWIYAAGYSAVLIVLLGAWASRAFDKHVVAKAG
jgi:fluoroquinolone transport system permease protein